MDDISKFINGFSHFQSALENSSKETVKAKFIEFHNEFPKESVNLYGLYGKYLEDKGIPLEEIKGYLLEPKEPTNVKIIQPTMLSSTQKNYIATRNIVDITEKTSLKEFREEFEQSGTVSNKFISIVIDEDEKYIKCKCDRCSKSSFIIKNK